MFEEFASQEDVFNHAVAPVSEKLLKGYNCTVIAYGQTGSGKTHTMMGVNGGADSLLALSERDDEPRVISENVEGMILKTIRMIFEKIQDSSPSIEYTIRCSYVEIYLEKILDLLNPSGDGLLSIVDDLPADEAAGVGDANLLAGVRIAGAAELCCFDETDVYCLLARGNACRTRSSMEMNTDSSRSHAIFVMTMEQNDKSSHTMTKSVLHMVDLAGSEMAATQSVAAQRSPGGASSIQTEAEMINKSLSALNNVIRAQLENQRGANHSVAALSNQSKLTKFLRPSFGGNCMTTLLLTASPSSYNIGETLSTIRFGQRVRRIHNPAVVNSDFSCEEYRKRLKESEKKQMDQFHLLRALAAECNDLKEQAREGTFEEDKHSGPLWNSINELIECSDQDEMDYKVSVRRRTNNLANDNIEARDELEEAQREIEKLREQLVSIRKAKDNSENQLSELQSEATVLRSQNEYLIENKKKDMQELIDAKNELQIMSQRKIEVEHNFRTSQFRENEAIVFLRQFRRFYRNVLRDKMARGSGNLQIISKEISEKVPNAPDLTELIDVDALLLEAGLIEEHELREDKTASVYVPSKTALIRSRSAAQKAAKKAEVIEKGLGAEPPEATASIKSEEASEPVNGESEPKRPPLPRRGSAIRRSSYSLGSVEPLDTEETKEEPSSEALGVKPSAGADAGAGSSQPADGGPPGSTSLWDQSGVNITRRQQLLGTPSGRLATMRDDIVEQELIEMAKRCIELEQELKEERATVELLSGKAGGLHKKQLAQEAIQLRHQIEKKTENLIAISWKMNELNLINKAYNEKMVNREQHLIYLEENYVELQNKNRVVIEERQESERMLREERDSLQKALGGMSVSLWQFNEDKPGKVRTFASRVVIPVQGGHRPSDIDTEPRPRRLSDAESEPSAGSQRDAVVEKADVGTLSLGFTTRDVVVEKVDANTQTEQVRTQADEAQTNDVETKELGIQTDDVHIDVDVLITMPNMAYGDVLLTTGAHTDKQGVLDDNSSAGELASVGAVGAARGAATAGIVSRAVHDDVTEDSNDVGAMTAAVSRVSDEDSNENLHAIDAVDAVTYTAAVGKESSAVTAGSPAAVTFAAVDETSKDSKAKNLFSGTTTVFSVMNRAHSSAKESELAEPKQIADEVESYQGDGHTHGRNLEEKDDMSDASCSRDIWAAARDDFDLIVEDTAKSVGTSRRHVPGEDHNEILNPDKSLNEFLDKAKTIGHKREDAVVAMGSKRSLLEEEEFGTVGEVRKPWEKGSLSPKRKPWEESRTIAEEKKQSPKRDYGTSVSSFNPYDDYLSDDASHDSVENENRNAVPRARRISQESAPDDDFDRMMIATQAALVAAEEIDENDDSVSSVPSEPLDRPENQKMKSVAAEDSESEGAESLKSQEDALFSGGRTNEFTPRRFAEKASTKIRAGVMKEEKKQHRTHAMKENKDHHHHHKREKSSRDLGGKRSRYLEGKSSRDLEGKSSRDLEGKSSRDVMRKRSEPRHESSVEEKKKKKKKESKKVSRRIVSERSPKREKESDRSSKREKDKVRSHSKSREKDKVRSRSKSRGAMI